MAIKGRVIKLETKAGMQLGKERRQHLGLYKWLSGSSKSIEQLHKEVPLDFRGLVSILESLPKAGEDCELS